LFLTLRNCLNFINDKCDELFLDDFIVCDEAHSGVYVTRSIREKRIKESSQDYWINLKQFLSIMIIACPVRRQKRRSFIDNLHLQESINPKDIIANNNNLFQL
jgi:hypothetical protein